MKLIATVLVLCVVVFASPTPSHSVITIGPYNLPDNAFADVVTQVGGSAVPSGIADWCNVANAALTVQTALAGAGNENTGICNLADDMVFQLDFTDNSVTNGIGPDLLFFDARFSDNSYSIAVSTDGVIFTASVAFAAASAISTGELRSYFFPAGTGGISFGATVWAFEINLDVFGIPANGTIVSIRFNGTNGEADPLGAAELKQQTVPTAHTTWGQVKSLFGP